MNKLNTAKRLAVVLKGFIAMVMQIIIIRELLIIFNGNELSLGIILTSWLLLEALGSGLLSRIFIKLKDNLKPFLILQILIALSLPLTIWLVRTSKSNWGIFYGEVVNLGQMFLICFTSLFIFSVLDGLQFFFACRLFSDKKEEGLAVSWTYILEALGMLLGGVIFTYFFLYFFNSFQIAFILIILSLSCVLFMCRISRINNRKLIFGFTLSLAIASIVFLFAGKIDLLQKLSIEKQFPDQKILDNQNSIYSNITVAQRQNQATFFSNGSPIVVVPIPDIAFAEEFVHLTLLFHASPEEILIISSGAGGILNEILKEPVINVAYAELDPLIIREIKKFSTNLTSKELNDPRVKIIYLDGRAMVKTSPKKYDTIFVNISSPTTLQANRLFTREFYQEASNILKTNGLISVRLPGSLTYLNDELCQLNNSIYKTLLSVYKNVLVIPGDFNLFLASNSLDLEKESAADIVSRFKKRSLKTNYLTEFSLNYRLDKSWKDWFFARLKDADRGNALNEDFSPRGLLFGLAFTYSLISPQTKNIFKLMSKITLPYILIFSVLLFALFISILNLNKKKDDLRKSLNSIILISGFCGITLELILILGFQIIYGFIYSWVGIISGAFMFGLSIGGFIVTSKFARFKNAESSLLKLEFAIITFSIALPLILISVSKINLALIAIFAKAIFAILSLLIGLLLGSEFSLANKIYFHNFKEAEVKFAQLYVFDLIGASSGAILSAVWLIPVLGILETGILIAGLKLGAVAVFILAIRK